MPPVLPPDRDLAQVRYLGGRVEEPLRSGPDSNEKIRVLQPPVAKVKISPDRAVALSPTAWQVLGVGQEIPFNCTCPETEDNGPGFPRATARNTPRCPGPAPELRATTVFPTASQKVDDGHETDSRAVVLVPGR